MTTDQEGVSQPPEDEGQPPPEVDAGTFPPPPVPDPPPGEQDPPPDPDPEQDPGPAPDPREADPGTDTDPAPPDPATAAELWPARDEAGRWTCTHCGRLWSTAQRAVQCSCGGGAWTLLEGTLAAVTDLRRRARASRLAGAAMEAVADQVRELPQRVQGLDEATTALSTTTQEAVTRLVQLASSVSELTGHARTRPASTYAQQASSLVSAPSGLLGLGGGSVDVALTWPRAFSGPYVATAPVVTLPVSVATRVSAEVTSTTPEGCVIRVTTNGLLNAGAARVSVTGFQELPGGMDGQEQNK